MVPFRVTITRYRSAVVGMAKASEDGLLLTITESGLGRRTPMKDYRLQSRGGKGVRNYHAEGKETRIAAAPSVSWTQASSSPSSRLMAMSPALRMFL